MKRLRQMRSKWLVWRGKAVDIWSKGPYPADVLSNLADNAFLHSKGESDPTKTILTEKELCTILTELRNKEG